MWPLLASGWESRLGHGNLLVHGGGGLLGLGLATKQGAIGVSRDSQEDLHYKVSEWRQEHGVPADGGACW